RADAQRPSRVVGGGTRAPARALRGGGAVSHQHIAGAGLLLATVFFGGIFNRDQGRSHVHGLAVSSVQFGDVPGKRRRDLYHGFSRLHFHHRLIDGDGIAYRNQPTHDPRLGQAFAQIRHVKGAHVSSHCRVSTASKTRSAWGSWKRSYAGGGYGMSKPVTRRTGAARKWK